MESYKQWVKERLESKPVFNDLQEARRRGEEKWAKDDVCAIYREPKKRGGRYALLTPDAYEVALREGYTLIDDFLKRDIDEIEEV